MVARTQTVVRRWCSLLALAIGLLLPAAAGADPIRFSTSGDLDFAQGTKPLSGVTDAAPGDWILIGSTPIPSDWTTALGDTPFHLEFQFNNNLPAIDVSGTIPWIGYNPDMPVQDVHVSTSATQAELGLYPTLFQNLLANPDWLHSTSYASSGTPLEVMMSVHPEDPLELRPVPEPSTVLIFAIGLGGLGWRARRRGRSGQR
jgi:hypothetical protein